MAIHGHKTRESRINSMLLIMGDHGTVKVDKSVDPRALPSGSTLPAEGDFSLAFSFPPERVTGALCIAIKTKFDPNGRITFGSAFLAFEQL